LEKGWLRGKFGKKKGAFLNENLSKYIEKIN
jgi:hypothetical protein